MTNGARAKTDETMLSGVVLLKRRGVFDVTLAEGRITGITPRDHPPQRLLLPLMADAHVHLDKAHTVSRTGATAKTLFEAIDLMDADKPNWTEEDLFDRANAALQDAWARGVGAMRSHVDWLSEPVPTAWHVLNDLRRSWRGRVDLQLAALTPLDMLADLGPGIAAQVKADDAVLGAFVYRNDDLSDKLAGVFDLARANDLPLDFHVDEGLDPEAQGFDEIVRLAGTASDAPPVLCGHGCALSVRPDKDVRRVLGAAARAGVGLTILPTTNCYLQDNTLGRTPRLRGVAPIQEARAEGVEVLIATDNVRDPFFPLGSFDLFNSFLLGVQLGHLEPDDWYGAVSTEAGKWCGSQASHEIETGRPADFIEIAATDLREALSLSPADRRIWRDGAPIHENEVT